MTSELGYFFLIFFLDMTVEEGASVDSYVEYIGCHIAYISLKLRTIKLQLLTRYHS